MDWTIEFCWGMLLTSCTGSLFFLVWRLAGRGLERAGLARVGFRLLKMTAISFILPAAYAFLKQKAVNRELGHGYLFSKSYGLFLASKIFLAVWILGAGALALSLIRDAWQLHRRLRSCMPCETEVRRQFEEVYRSLGGKGRRLEVCYSYCFAAPCMCGVLRPKVILPVRRYGKDELRVIFTHEITHYLQGAMLLKWGVLLVRAVHFFNPLAWLLCREVQRWSEYACDIRACSAIGGARQYFQVIANMALFSAEGTLPEQLVESKNELAERIDKVKEMNRNRKKGVMTKLAAVGLAGAVYAAGSVSAYAATVKSADLYVYLHHLTTVEEEEEYVPWVDDYVEYTEEGYAEGIVVRTGEIYRITRSCVGMEWTINGGEAAETEAFSCKKGDTISVSMGISPDNISVKVGIIKPDGRKTYIWGKGDKVAHDFSVSVSGSYKVFVENGTGTAVDVDGSYHVY